jgi:hypothetical protein
MTPRAFTLLSVMTIIGIAAAGFAVSREPGFMIAGPGEVIFPELNTRINDATKIVVQTSERTMTMALGESGWTLAESGGYGVQLKIAKGAILGFAGLTYVEAKTDRADKHHKLELRKPNAAGSKGRAVKIFAKNGDLLVDVILGKVRYNMPGTTRDGVYIRKSDETQTWLALGQLDVSRLPSDWLAQKIVDIQTNRIRSSEIRHPDGEVLHVSKTTQADRRFKLAGIPDGKKLTYDGDPDNMASVLEEFELTDVKRTEDMTFSPKETINTRLTTFDGLIVDIKMMSRIAKGASEAEHWVTLTAQAASPDDAERQKEARQINAHTGPWAFQIPGYKASRLNKRMAEMLKNQQPDS